MRLDTGQLHIANKYGVCIDVASVTQDDMASINCCNISVGGTTCCNAIVTTTTDDKAPTRASDKTVVTPSISRLILSMDQLAVGGVALDIAVIEQYLHWAIAEHNSIVISTHDANMLTIARCPAVFRCARQRE